MAQNANFSPTRRGVDPLVDDDHPLLILRVFLLAFFPSFLASSTVRVVFAWYFVRSCYCAVLVCPAVFSGFSSPGLFLLFSSSASAFRFSVLSLLPSSSAVSLLSRFSFSPFSLLLSLSSLHASISLSSRSSFACPPRLFVSLLLLCFLSSLSPPLSLSVSSSSPLCFFLLSVSFSLSPSLPLSSSLLFSSLFSFSPSLPLSPSLSTIPLDVHFP